jgi:sugar phosphate isomerase/epimerase
LGAKKGYQFANQTRVRIPAGFDWQKVWQALVISCRECAQIAAGYGKTVIMEPRVGEVICSADSLLRLIEHVARPNFQANFDTGHFSAQRENVVLALAKLRGKFANIHISDNDPVSTAHLPIGDGSIDWLEFFRVLKAQHYAGYLGLDLGMSRTLARDYRKSLDRLQAIASVLKLPLEV